MSEAEQLALLVAALRPTIEKIAREVVAEQLQSAAAPAVRLLSVADVAKRLGLQDDAVYGKIKSGVLPAVRLPGCKSWRIREDALEAALAQSGATPADSGTRLADLTAIRAQPLAAAVKKGRFDR